MKIYSWNMLYSNKRRKAALTFIGKADFDIFCMQEVPESFLPRLEEMSKEGGYEMESVPELDRGPAHHPRREYLVILSKYPIRDPQHLPLPEHCYPFHVRFYLWALALLRLRRRAVGNRNNFYADVDTPQGTMRVFCLHLPLTYPRMRIEEFDRALNYHDHNYPAIVCGDFNILETFYATTFNWLLGGTLSEAISKSREREIFEELFAKYKLQNLHRERSTHAFSRSQLDHILVPESFKVVEAKVIRRTHGSDHNPVFAEVIPE